MKRLHWDWQQVQECPVYVRTYLLDFMQMEDDAQRKAQEKARSARAD